MFLYLSIFFPYGDPMILAPIGSFGMINFNWRVLRYTKLLWFQYRIYQILDQSRGRRHSFQYTQT